METLNAFETLAQKVERIVDKYETVVKDKAEMERQLLNQQIEREDLLKKIDDFTQERSAVREKIDALLQKIEQLGV